MGGPGPFIAWAEFYDVLDGLGFDSTSRAPDSFVWMEASCVGANKGLTRNEVDYRRSSLPRPPPISPDAPFMTAAGFPSGGAGR